jgi:hypothetical protein
MVEDPKLDYADPATRASRAGRSIGTWVTLLLVWAVGLVVWVVYLAAILYLLYKLL